MPCAPQEADANMKRRDGQEQQEADGLAREEHWHAPHTEAAHPVESRHEERDDHSLWHADTREQ